MVMLMLAPNISKALGYGYGYSSLRYRVRWSPYAFRHGRSGLISGYFGYSPYAFSHKNPSGLVYDYDYDDVRYSPYAFSYKNPSGLVTDYDYSSNVTYVRNWEFSRVLVQPAQSFEDMKKAYQEKMRLRKAEIKHCIESRKAVNLARENDGWLIIFNYLKSENIDFKIRNRLSIQNKTLCCEFLLRDGHLIKYRNPEAIEQAKTNPRYNEFYEKYQQDWTEFCKEYTGRIYEIKFAS